jgi:phage/plasmid primase-like uncharacterized protein
MDENLKAPVDIVLKVDITEKDDVKVLGAKWSPKDKTWYIPKGERIKYLTEWLPDGKLKTLNDEMLYVNFEENETARSAGAVFDWEIKRWILPAGKDIKAIPFRFFSESNLTATKVKKSFYDLVEEFGLVITGEPIKNGRMQRVPLRDEKPGKKGGAYVIYEDINGWGGYVENHKTGQKETFRDSAAPMDEYQRKEVMRRKEANRANIDHIREKAAKRAARLIKSYKRAAPTHHPYLQIKKVQPYGIYENERGQLAVVLQDVKGKIRSLQFINTDGKKIYLPGGQKYACFHMIGGGRTLFNTDLENLVICEGFATGASIYEATGYTVICAMDCGNILPVARAIREEYGDDFRLIIAGDDDHAVRENPGRRFAEEAAVAIDGIAIFPEFDKTKHPNLTDFNDLAQIHGVKEVEEQFKKIVK